MRFIQVKTQVGGTVKHLDVCFPALRSENKARKQAFFGGWGRGKKNNFAALICSLSDALVTLGGAPGSWASCNRISTRVAIPLDEQTERAEGVKDELDWRVGGVGYLLEKIKTFVVKDVHRQSAAPAVSQSDSETSRQETAKRFQSQTQRDTV